MFERSSLWKYGREVDLATLESALASSKRVVLAPHLSSYIDAALFASSVGRRMTVAVTPQVARNAAFQRFSGMFDHEVVDTSDPTSLKRLCEIIEANELSMIFPELEPTTNGLIQKISDVVIAAFERTGATIVTAAAANSQFTEHSRMRDRLHVEMMPKIRLVSSEPMVLGRGGAKGASRLAVERGMNDALARGLWDKKPLFDTLIEMRDIWGANAVMAMEPDGTRVTRRDMVIRVELLAKIFKGLSSEGEAVGIMLPNTHMTLASLIAMQRAGRVPAMINYSMGSRSLLGACSVARVTKIVSSRKFAVEGKFEPLIEQLEADGLKFFYLEDLTRGLSKRTLLGAVISAATAKPSSAPIADAQKTALILFTSGSEGTPKAVALSHMNIQANTAQIRTALPFYSSDVMAAVLPMFHSYGLCTGILMPISSGMAVAFYPTPLHYKKIPQYINETRATVLLGTNTFLAGYAKSADPFDFADLRMVVCGGDKLRESTNALWRDRFGIRIFEGYGVTECSPVVGVNRFGHYKFGSIGMALPMIESRLDPVEGVHGAGRLVLRGPNVMTGYLQPDGTLLPPKDGWYDTGDICSIDEEGFITIEGRAKRFAKSGGEMISLAHVEEAVQEIWPDDVHAVVSVPDESRGEMIVMLTERKTPDREELRAGLIARGLPEIAVPKKLFHIDEMPRIGVGKTDYQSAVRTVKEMMK